MFCIYLAHTALRLDSDLWIGLLVVPDVAGRQCARCLNSESAVNRRVNSILDNTIGNRLFSLSIQRIADNRHDKDHGLLRVVLIVVRSSGTAIRYVTCNQNLT